jgi:hypothetical protein
MGGRQSVCAIVVYAERTIHRGIAPSPSSQKRNRPLQRQPAFFDIQNELILMPQSRRVVFLEEETVHLHAKTSEGFQ